MRTTSFKLACPASGSVFVSALSKDANTSCREFYCGSSGGLFREVSVGGPSLQVEHPWRSCRAVMVRPPIYAEGFDSKGLRVTATIGGLPAQASSHRIKSLSCLHSVCCSQLLSFDCFSSTVNLHHRHASYGTICWILLSITLSLPDHLCHFEVHCYLITKALLEAGVVTSAP